ncbi:MAG: hypothetical protein JXR52_09915 [Bacteroidales bacterium]|nr:hypothetical protein [Bacteroidales bacterium]MBN2699132.1 hypothetical protein [Bacteroidales bacterium]
MARYVTSLILIIAASVLSCDRNEPHYSDIPHIDYQSFSLYYEVDTLEQLKLSGDLLFNFTDGDGDIGLLPVSENPGTGLPDTILYNLFLQLHDYRDNGFIKIPEDEGGFYKYRIPYLDKKPLTGSISIKIDYPTIKFDTIFYTFYLYDRAFHKSNTDSSDIIIFTGIEPDSIKSF